MGMNGENEGEGRRHGAIHAISAPTFGACVGSQAIGGQSPLMAECASQQQALAASAALVRLPLTVLAQRLSSTHSSQVNRL